MNENKDKNLLEKYVEWVPSTILVLFVQLACFGVWHYIWNEVESHPFIATIVFTITIVIVLFASIHGTENVKLFYFECEVVLKKLAIGQGIVLILPFLCGMEFDGMPIFYVLVIIDLIAYLIFSLYCAFEYEETNGKQKIAILLTEALLSIVIGSLVAIVIAIIYGLAKSTTRKR